MELEKREAALSKLEAAADKGEVAAQKRAAQLEEREAAAGVREASVAGGRGPSTLVLARGALQQRMLLCGSQSCVQPAF